MWQYRHCGCADQAHDAPACTAGLQLLGCWTLLLKLRTGARFLLQTLGTALVTVQDAAVARAFLLGVCRCDRSDRLNLPIWLFSGSADDCSSAGTSA